MRIPRAQRLPLPEGEYYQSDLVGYEVVERGGRRVPTLTVRQVLSKPCMSIGPRATLHAAAHTLLECRIGALPIVEGGEILGIVTQTDLLRRCLGVCGEV